MDWATILPGIKALFGTLTGLQVTDTSAPLGFTNARLRGQLHYHVTSVVGIGEDEYRWSYNSGASDPNQSMTLNICGNRVFTLTVRFEGYDQGDNTSARYYLEKIYTRLSRPSSLASCRALGCCWTDAGPYVDLDKRYAGDERVYSVGAKDFKFAYAENDPDDSAADSPIGYIQNVVLASQYLYSTDGVSHPAQDQINLTVTS